MHITHVVAARPNFMKAAPVLAALGKRGARQTLVHTGQHYDANLSDALFEQLGLPAPDLNLGVGSGTHAEQTAQVMIGMERALLADRPQILVVYGDVNSTMAATLAAAKAGVPVAHVEAGLRSGDLSMPEEINRLVTDRLATWHLTHSSDADDNLKREGVDAASIHLVGNVMIDTLTQLLPLTASNAVLERLGLVEAGVTRRYSLATLHRPSNVDNAGTLSRLLAALETAARVGPVVFPMHPRTRRHMEQAGFRPERVIVTEPLSYLDFLTLQRHAAVVITDSGGVQEETTYLGVPCLTMRTTTERPITVTLGTNQLLGDDTERMQAEVVQAMEGRGRTGTIPPLWDGHAAERIAEVLVPLGSRGRATMPTPRSTGTR